jgi:L-2-hydroxyglutarate oxidase LhgO
MINCTGIESSIFHKKNIDPNLDLHPNPVVGAYLTLKKKIKLNTIIYTSLVPGSITERVDATPTLQNNIIFGPSVDTDLPDPMSLIDRFYKVISKYIEIDKDNLEYTFYGIRPKAKNNQKTIKDFIFLKDSKNSMSLINIESPGFTSCLAIADYVSEKI